MRLAKIISYLFHPLVVPSIAMLLLFQMESSIGYTLSYESKAALFGVLFVLTILLPLLMLSVMYRLKIIPDFYLKSREHRLLPLALLLLLFLLFWWRFDVHYLPLPYQMLFQGLITLSFLSLLISIKVKISMHLIASGALAGLIAGVMIYSQANLVLLLSFSILFGGIVGWARLMLKAHQPYEIYLGYVIGFLAILVPFLIA